MREHVGNVSLSGRPHEDVLLTGAFRVRGEKLHGQSDFTETDVGGAPTFTTALQDLETESDTDDLSVAQEVEIRYTGIDNLVLYSSGRWEENNGDIDEREFEPVAAVVEFERRSDIDQLLQKYAVGAKAYPARWIQLSGEYSYRLSEYDYEHHLDSTVNDSDGPDASSDRYPAFLVDQDFSTHDLGLRTTLRLPADVSVVLRYDWLQSVIDTHPDDLEEIESAEVRSHVLGATVTYNPVPWWWTRTGVNYVRSTTDTAANDYDTPVRGFFPSFDNDYVMTTLASGLAVDARTSLEFAYNWISADNYHDLSASTVAYRSRFDEHQVGAKVVHKIGEHTKVSGGYSYCNNDEFFSGGNYNYDSHLITTGVEFEY
jgi:hypothetical protein